MTAEAKEFARKIKFTRGAARRAVHAATRRSCEPARKILSVGNRFYREAVRLLEPRSMTTHKNYDVLESARHELDVAQRFVQRCR